MRHAVLAIPLVLLATVRAFAIDDHVILNRMIRADAFSNSTPDIYAMCELVDVPCGIEISRLDWPLRGTTGRRFSQREKVSMQRLLNSLIERHPKYSWRIEGGVVLVTPNANGRETGQGSPLDASIDSLQLDNVPLDLAAVEMCQHAGRFCAREGISIVGGIGTPRRISLRLQGITLRDALNELVRKDGHSLWSFMPRRPSADIGASFWVRLGEIVRPRIDKLLGRSPAPLVRHADIDHVRIVEWGSMPDKLQK